MRVELEVAGHKFVARKTVPGEIVVCMDRKPTKYRLNFTEQKTKLHPSGGPSRDQLTVFLQNVAYHMLDGVTL